MTTDQIEIIKNYEAAAPVLIEKFNALSSSELYAHLLDLFADQAGRDLLDIGAGTGRDAAWFSDMGYNVTAVEPVDAFRESGMARYQNKDIVWIDDRLPSLAKMRERGLKYDIVTICAVWQHLSEVDRKIAMRQLSSLVRPGGAVIMSLRHGDGAPDRPCFPVDIEDTVTSAVRNGFELVVTEDRDSVQPTNQARGITWTWLVLQKKR